mmetsp:Transcript_53530/g.114791  ORF Transcript_53530/g.114791 Transcript_53530/m.114791 type:complete len:253 (-) Transcript_53530:211-969(-)
MELMYLFARRLSRFPIAPNSPGVAGSLCATPPRVAGGTPPPTVSAVPRPTGARGLKSAPTPGPSVSIAFLSTSSCLPLEIARSGLLPSATLCTGGTQMPTGGSFGRPSASDPTGRGGTAGPETRRTRGSVSQTTGVPTGIPIWFTEAETVHGTRGLYATMSEQMSTSGSRSPGSCRIALSFVAAAGAWSVTSPKVTIGTPPETSFAVPRPTAARVTLRALTPGRCASTRCGSTSSCLPVAIARCGWLRRSGR